MNIRIILAYEYYDMCWPINRPVYDITWDWEFHFETKRHCYERLVNGY